MAIPKITIPTRAQALQLVNTILSITKNERKQDIPETLVKEIQSTTKDYLKKWYAEVPGDNEDLIALKTEEAEAKDDKPKPEWVVLKVSDEQAYVFTTCLAIHKPESDPYAKFAPHEIGLDTINARLKAYITRETQDNKRAVTFKCLGDFLEYGSKKRLKEWGLVLKTKIPCYLVNTDPSLSPRHIILTIGKDNEYDL